jgi:hypothetical protein
MAERFDLVETSEKNETGNKLHLDVFIFRVCVIIVAGCILIAWFSYQNHP